ncbi:hypothetical protein K402DRAFT_419462 [Aulographum hederae CBS 113979]|uniref:Uncharacterized protein n=1 Tax=Aulographum hederae CBS 113979 TaxID=1176131 RepID=A0A6G1H5Z7_9PEZI|nr:hypothetical protein K402DRAFT_419462 [Aulographum hederae CBS 113979]
MSAPSPLPNPTTPTQGGFLHPSASLLSPPPSSIASSAGASSLPHPRQSPLRPGGPKESAFVRFIDQELLRIQRRHAKRETDDALEAEEEAGLENLGDLGGVKGYRVFGELAKDVERVVGLVWTSGTPSLQIPYFLTLALLTSTFLPSYPPAPKAMFRLLGKLDLVFASLLQGRNIETGENLPGFERGRKVNGTEKVRIKSLVERTRVAVVDVMSSGDFAEEESDDDEEDAKDTQAEESEMEDGMVVEMETDIDDEADRAASRRNRDVDMDLQRLEDGGGWEMDVAKVYDRTVVELGDTIGGAPIGIITDD